jgi:hypothetical protein
LQITRKLALCGASLGLTLAPAVALAAGSAPATTPSPPPTVTVRIEGAARTLLAQTAVKAPTSGWITKGGAPKGSCPAASAAGALNRATGGRWTGKYYASVPGIFITSILGVKPSNPNKYYWGVFVNNRTSNLGVCSIKLTRGEKLLFAITDGSQVPLVLRAPATARVGSTITATTGSWSKSSFVPAVGVHVTAPGLNDTTDKHGQVKIPITHTGTLTLHANGTGFIRAAAVRVRELP